MRNNNREKKNNQNRNKQTKTSIYFILDLYPEKEIA